VAVEELDDGGIISGGTFNIGGGGFEDDRAIVRKLDGRGRLIWTHVFDEISILDAVVGTRDGGCLVGTEGLTYGGGWLVRLDGSGNTLWDHNFPPTVLGSCRSVRRTMDGGSIAVGMCTLENDFAQGDAVAYLTEGGALMWSHQFVNGRFSMTEVHDAAEASNGDIVVTGRTYSMSPDTSVHWIYFMVARMNRVGQVIWERHVATDYAYITGQAIYPAAGGGFIVACSYEFPGISQLYLMRIDDNGDSLWSRQVSVGRPLGPSDFVRANDGGYLTTGNCWCVPGVTWEAYLAKLDSSGTPSWFTIVGNGVAMYEGWACGPTCDGGYLMAGDTYDVTRPYRGSFVTRLQPDGPAHSCGSRPLLKVAELDQNYPNPCNASTRITMWLTMPGHARLRVFNLLGRQVTLLHEGELPMGTSQFVLKAESLPSGSYFYQLEAGGSVQTKKMIILR